LAVFDKTTGRTESAATWRPKVERGALLGCVGISIVGYDIDAAPLHERPDIIATRIVWLDPLAGTAKELLAEAEGQDEDDKTSKVAEAMVFLKTALAHGERLGREVAAEAKKAGISERTLERAAKGTVGKRKAALGWYWWSLP
jgi:putative DNA primase/helicase